MDNLIQDIRYGVRMLLKKPGFALVAALALGLGIGANAAIFSVVNSVLLRPLPLKDSDGLARLYEENFGHNFIRQSASGPNFSDWREQNRVFERMAAYRPRFANLIGGDEPERIQYSDVSSDFFAVLRVTPILGRAFTPEESAPGGPDITVLSYGFWQRHFGGDPYVLGRTLILDGNSFTVIGVMPPEAQFPDGTEVWRPMRFDFAQLGRRSQFLSVIARLKSDVTWQQAQSEMTTIGRRLAEQYPGPNSGWSVAVVSLNDVVVGEIRPALFVLLGAVAFVLLIACANVANLLLARAASREKEMAIRAALGAGRLRMVRQLLTESSMLALLGGAFGLLLAYWGIRLLIALSPADIPRVDEIDIDGRVLAFTLVVSLVTGLVFGLAPAMQSARADLNKSLKEGGRTGAGTSGRRVRSLLVIAEVALSLVLLIGAGLMVRSFQRLRDIDPGFDTENALTLRVSLPLFRYSENHQLTAFSEEVIRRLVSLPGIEAAAAVTNLPLGESHRSNSFVIEGRPPLPDGEFIAADNNRASPDYFRAMGIPLLKGRIFEERDTEGAPTVAIISETMARRFWPDEDPIGQRVTLHDGGPNPRQIVGIVGDVKSRSFKVSNVKPMIYTPYSQSPDLPLTLIVRASSDPLALVGAARSEVRAIDKDLPIDNVMALDQMVSDSVSQERFSTLLLVTFAVVAMSLAMVGIYGVMSYSVTQRTRELGIRMALGASQSDILKLVVGESMALVSIGIVAGLIAAFAVTRVMTGLLYGVSATDPTTFIAISLILSGVALAASYLPARRATKADPMVALRYE